MENQDYIMVLEDKIMNLSVSLKTTKSPVEKLNITQEIKRCKSHITKIKRDCRKQMVKDYH